MKVAKLILRPLGMTSEQCFGRFCRYINWRQVADRIIWALSSAVARDDTSHHIPPRLAYRSTLVDFTQGVGLIPVTHPFI
jgi:hypothetical protein